MFNKVIEQRPSYNNNNHISKSVSLSKLKLIYYQIFKYLYSIVGSYASTVIVNGSWTENHISLLWNISSNSNSTSDNRHLIKIYPPCNTEKLISIPLRPLERKRMIVSVGQFRPEKDHLLQLR